MLITKYDPFKDFRDLEKRLFTNNFTTITDEDCILGFTPVVNTREGKYAFHLEVDLPGVKKEDIIVDVHNKKLTIYGERKYKKETREQDYYKVESNYGKFQRVFNLPEGADVENISAATDNGVLEVIIPKQDKAVENKKVINID